MLIKFNLSIQEKFYKFLDYLYCSHKGICQKHRTPLTTWGGRKVICPTCEDEKLEKKVEKENNNEK